MSKVDVERRLTEVLQRRAEDAMSRTDTQQELRDFLARGAEEATRARSRSRLAVAVGAAAVAAVAAGVAGVFWGVGLTQDRADRGPVQQPAGEALRVAEQFVAAYIANDPATIATLAANEEDLPWWRLQMDRNDAWGVQYMREPCRETTTNRLGTGVLCPFSLHVLHSEELGRGPFEDANFTVWVGHEGKVFDADPAWNFVPNGMGEHVSAVSKWIFETYPQDRDLLSLDEPEVPAEDWDRWLALWEGYAQDYLEAHRDG